MACLDMSTNQNSDHRRSLSCSSPRISFSNDFAESNHHHQTQIKPRSDNHPPPPSDFEFSSGSTSHSNSMMMSADELFCKGRLLPSFKKPITLREELLMGDDEEEEYGDGFSMRPPKGSGSGSTLWKEILGLKKTHIGSRKPGKGPGLVRDPGGHVATKSSQELLNDGRSSGRDFEFGM